MISSKATLRKIQATGLFALAVGGMTAAAACSGSTNPTAPAAPAENAGATTSHAIHVFIKQPDGSKRLVDFGPGTDVAFPGNSQTSGSVGARPLGRHPSITPFISDAAGPVVQSPTVVDPGTDIQATAWELVARAADACSYDGTIEPYNGYIVSSRLPPWGRGDGFTYWYIYNVPAGAPDCSGRLYMEQSLVCVADKLSQIADAVGDVIWPPLPIGACPPTSPYEYGEGDAAVLGNGTGTCEYAAGWDIPPQADADRFIARDLAIHTLAMIPVLDSYTDVLGQSCATSFAQVANNGSVLFNGQQTPLYPITATTQPLVGDVFGVGLPLTTSTAPTPVYPPFPPSNLAYVDSNGSNLNLIARTALDINAQILRSGGRLLHDLIRRDVYSDLAAAAQQSAQSLDPISGNEAAWGALDGGSGYGTIAHAARVLLGRWEIGDKAGNGGIPTTVADPKCEGAAELSLLHDAFGSDYSARYLDREIRTSGEQTAVQLVERSGIVIPSCKIPSPGNAKPLQQALINQLLLSEQVQNNLPTMPPATAITNVVNGLTDDELIFAFQRALLTWRLLTNTADTTAPGGGPDGGTVACAGSPLLNGSDMPAGLNMALYPADWPSLGNTPLVYSGVNDLLGVVVDGGLSRSRLVTDPIARAAGMLEASQCEDVSTQWDEWGDPTPSMATALKAESYAYLPPVAFQDSFEIGQAFERRLNSLRAAAAPLASFQDPTNVAKGGIAELRSWAGSTIVHAWPWETGATDQVTSFVVRVGGISPDDFGMADTSDLTPVLNAFTFVYGPPWVAECAAGVRPDCPTEFASLYEQSATQVADVTSNFTNTGVLDDVYELTVPISSSAAKYFTPPISGGPPPNPEASHLYMVRVNDPTSTTGHGRVMGTLPLYGRFIYQAQSAVAFTTGFVDAPMQRELLEDAIDVGHWVGARPPALGDPSAAQSSGYCVDGVRRNLFVPLDNELVSGSQTYEDSWQAYLSLAQTAAQTADTLGQALISNDLQISENQQAAEEQIANICGDFGALSSATVATDGKVTPGTDPATEDCINEPTTDVVFLGQLPASIAAAGSDATAAIKAVLNCDGGADGGPPASAVALCKHVTLTADALNIGIPDAGAPADGGDGGPQVLSSDCNDLLTVVAPSIRTSFNAQGYLTDLQDPSQSPSGMQTAASQLQMIVDIHNHWQVNYGNEKIMDSLDLNYWPGCLWGTCPTPAALSATPASTPTSAGAGPNLITATMATAWSTVFRNCRDGNSPTTTEMGGCDPDVQGDSDPETELNMLKWRVTQALWMLAASSGVLPQGMVYQPIPGFFTDKDVQSNATISGTDGLNGGYLSKYNAGGASNYYAGSLAASSTCNDPLVSSCWVLASSDPNSSVGDVTLAGTAYDIEGSFGEFGEDLEVPSWEQFLYLPDYGGSAQYGGPTKHILAANAGAIFDQCSVTINGGRSPFSPPTCPPQDPDAGSGTPSSPTPVSFASLVGAAVGLDGIQCELNFGQNKLKAGKNEPTFGQGEPNEWWELVGSVKLGVSEQSTMAQVPGQPDFWELATAAPAPDGIGEGVPTSLAVNITNPWDQSPVPSDTAAQQKCLGPGGGTGCIPWYPGIAAYVLPPTMWPPAQRAISFAGFGAVPNHTCGATTLLLQASALACTPAPAASTSAVNLGPPPAITKLSDVVALEAWLGKASSTIQAATGSFYLQEIPTQVVKDFKNSTVGSGALGGTRGQAILTMEQQIQNFPSSWTSIGSDLSSISSAIAIAESGGDGGQPQRTDRRRLPRPANDSDARKYDAGGG